MSLTELVDTAVGACLGSAITTVLVLNFGSAADSREEALHLKGALCKEQFGRVTDGKNIPRGAALMFDTFTGTCKSSWKNADGTTGKYSWNPVENVVTFPAAAVKTPAAMVPAQ